MKRRSHETHLLRELRLERQWQGLGSTLTAPVQAGGGNRSNPQPRVNTADSMPIARFNW